MLWKRCKWKMEMEMKMVTEAGDAVDVAGDDEPKETSRMRKQKTSRRAIIIIATTSSGNYY